MADQGVDAGDSAAYGFQAYAVLTVSRIAARLRSGSQLSKREAARWAAAAYPEWGDWIGWAEAWWYEAGSQDNPPPADGRDVRQFVAHRAGLFTPESQLPPL